MPAVQVLVGSAPSIIALAAFALPAA